MGINFKMIRPFLEKHGPTILTGLASIGVVLTGYLTHKATMDTLSDTTEAVLFEDDSDIPVKQTVRRIVRENWKRYIPAGITGLATIACIIGVDRC